MINEEIYAEVDSTLDQLIKNAEAMNKASKHELTKEEIDAFQKTQESLLAHLIHMDGILEKKQKEIKIPNKQSVSYNLQKKMKKFEELNHEFIDQVSESMSLIRFKKKKVRKKPIRTKRRMFSRSNKGQVF